MFLRKIRTLYNRVSTSEKPKHSKNFLFLSLSSPSLPDLYLFSSFSLLSFFLSFFLSFLSSSPLLFPFSPPVRSCSGEPSNAPRRAAQRATHQARPSERPRRDPGRPTGTSPGQIRPSPGPTARTLSRTARTRAPSFALTLFRRQLPHSYISTCSCCRYLHARAFESGFRGP